MGTFLQDISQYVCQHAKNPCPHMVTLRSLVNRSRYVCRSLSSLNSCDPITPECALIQYPSPINVSHNNALRCVELCASLFLPSLLHCSKPRLNSLHYIFFLVPDLQINKCWASLDCNNFSIPLITNFRSSLSLCLIT